MNKEEKEKKRKKVEHHEAMVETVTQGQRVLAIAMIGLIGIGAILIGSAEKAPNYTKAQDLKKNADQCVFFTRTLLGFFLLITMIGAWSCHKLDKYN